MAEFLVDSLKALGYGEGRQAQPSAALGALRDAGYVGAFIYYSGGGDEGGTDQATFVKADGIEVAIDPWPAGLVYDHLSDSYTHDDPAVLASWQLLNLLEKPMHDKHGSWADDGSYRAEGILIYDVPNWQAVMKEQEQMTNYEQIELDLLDEYWGDDGRA